MNRLLDSGRSSVAALAAAIAAMAVVVLFATGGGGRVLDPVAQAAAVSTSAPGYRMTMSMELAYSGVPTAITATGAGSFDPRHHAGSFALDMDLPQLEQTLGSSTLHIEEIVNGLTVYMKLPSVVSSRLGGLDKPWMKLDLAKAAAASGVQGLSSLTSSSMTGDPSQLLQYLRATSGDVTVVGGDFVDGMQTTHYHGEVSLDQVADAVPSQERDAAKRAVAEMENLIHVNQMPVDVWVDAHHLVRKVEMSMNAAGPDGQALTMAIRLDIPHYGPQQPPTLPPADQVSDLSL